MAVFRPVPFAFGAWLCALGCQSHGPTLLAEPLGAPAGPPVAGAPAQAGSALPVGTAAPSALVELFTSEGCSSCPAADESLARLTDEAQRDGKRVFSDRAHSVRQGAYAERMANNGTYTPQMVVNGAEELVGSDAKGARAAIARALQEPAQAAVAVDVRRVGKQIELSYRVTAPGAVDLQLALADDVAETRVTAGENSDRILHHRHVVRAFKTLHVAASAAGVWQAPWHAARPGGVFAAAYATDPTTLRVLGAGARSLPAAE